MGFLGSFWKDKRMVGALSPSSRFLAKKMLKHIDFSQDGTFVELGPGTGVFTKKILDKMSPNSTLLVFELNDTFMDKLTKEIKDKRLILVHDSAEKIGEYLSKNNLGQANAVISSLPLANFPNEVKHTILEESNQNLIPNGTYVQFQYSLNAKKAIKSHFAKVSIDFALLNIPPAFVYNCKK